MMWALCDKHVAERRTCRGPLVELPMDGALLSCAHGSVGSQEFAVCPLEILQVCIDDRCPLRVRDVRVLSIQVGVWCTVC